MKERSFPMRVWALLVTLLMIESGWAATPTSSPELPDPGSVGISKQEQEQVGRQAMACGVSFVLPLVAIVLVAGVKPEARQLTIIGMVLISLAFAAFHLIRLL